MPTAKSGAEPAQVRFRETELIQAMYLLGYTANDSTAYGMQLTVVFLMYR